jgi:single-stranded-DNA-specific exonuclease
MPAIHTRPCPTAAFAALEQSGLDPRLARLYAARGVAARAEVEHRLSALLPPSGLLDIDRAATLLADAIRERKKLLIVADYDADGATACAVGVRGLTLLGARVDYLVPNRIEHGYGLSPAVVELAVARQPDLIVTVDNGIAAVEGVAAANAHGIPVLVTDHHLPGDVRPDAIAIVNPNQHGCTFASKNLAGVGVMFYVLLATRAELRRRGAYSADAQSGQRGVYEKSPEPDLRELLDRVALGTVADVVKLDANNRTLVAAGLAQMRRGAASSGVKALFAAAGRDPRAATVFDLGFMLGPRLNAAGRLDDMALGIACLLAENETAALPLAQQLDTLNRERRSIEADMQDDALAQLASYDPGTAASLTAYQPDWHVGVVGILASRLKDKFHRPTVVLAQADDGTLKGSGRSIPGLHLRDALDLVDKRAPGLILKFGGHAMAAGLTLAADRHADFARVFETVVAGLVSAADLEGLLETDGELPARAHDYEFACTLEAAVWGQGFPAPLFDGVFRVVRQRVVGEKHLKLQLEREGVIYEAMRFFHPDPLPETIRAVYALMPDTWNGEARVKLKIQHWEAVAG